MKNKENQHITIEKASEHNLKDISLRIPHHRINCFTGVSGSGKSSLVYDIICKESQRRYFETFSTYAKQFIGKMSRPEVEHIKGLMPAISVDQKTVSKNPRSTVGTMTELYDYLRLLFARLGEVPDEYKIENINRSLFSFNSADGFCPSCKGLGVVDQIDAELLIKDPNKSLREGALKITTPSGYTIYSQVTIDVLDMVCNSEGFNVDIPWKDLTDFQKNIIFNGSNKIKIPFGKHTLESRMKWSGITAKPREEGYYKGILPIMENILRVDRNPNILKFAKTVKCKYCNGSRLNKNALAITINQKNIFEYSSLSISELKSLINDTKFKNEYITIANQIKDKIIDRCKTLEELGLGYLTLTRESTTLSGGEAQRIRLATQVGNGLRGILYILDEPSIGLHPHDNNRMISIMKKLRDQGNTILVVEHDKETMLNADNIFDIGPLAGKNGGELLLKEPVKDIFKVNNNESQTLQYIKHSEKPGSPLENLPNKWLNIKNANLHNLKNISTAFRLHSLNVVTGVSGAGKSTLVFNLLGNHFEKLLSGDKIQNPSYNSIESDSEIFKIIEIDQSPIGRTPRSNPATYTKVFDLIRKLFANQSEAKIKNWNQSHFSFNTKGGRCDTCEGAGSVQTGMHFLSNVETICETCQGKRYKPETLQIKYKGKSISEILEMEISEAKSFFADEPKINHYLETMVNLGLGYLSLGQSATTLSGGEAQRLKLATELVKPTKEHTLYLFDEPTTGLHAYDIKILNEALRNLTIKGHTVIVIEHDADVIKKADHIIDLGPESGDLGGKVVFEGSYNDLLNCQDSLTAKALTKKITQNITLNPILESIIDAPISLKGIKTNNLKNIDVDFPRNEITVITGISGSGKSSLAFDTLFAEGQFRFTESFSTYTRSLIQQKAKPDIANSIGITPTIAIESKSVTKNQRATVGTITGINDLYRLLYSRISKNAIGNKCQEYSSYFSFNHESGACKACNGLGFEFTCNPEKLISNPDLPLNSGAMKGSKPGAFYGDPFGQYMAILNEVGKQNSIDFNQPWNKLNENAKEIALYGSADNEYHVIWSFKRKNRVGTHEFKGKWLGLSNYINDEFIRKQNKQGGENVAALMKKVNCKHCNGTRLKKDVLEYKVAGKNINEISSLESSEALIFFENINQHINSDEILLTSEIIKSIKEKHTAMCQIGLAYLSCNRETTTLSGGEGRRVRMISQLGGELIGITYILDEPTVGLHSKDSENLIKLLKKLSEQNTVVVVEHDEDVIKCADYIIELGPEAGVNGGRVIAKGNKKSILQNSNSITAKYLNSNYKLPFKKELLDINFDLKIKNANANNLKNFNISLPSNGITTFSGVSGSGKTSLLFDIIAKSSAENKSVNCDSISGLESFTSIIHLDQNPIGKNTLSTPVTFLNLYDDIRSIYAKTNDAVNSKLKPSHFSYNSKDGQCDNCKGQGQIKISMDFLSDVEITCSKCDGKRFKKEILNIKWNGNTISDILSKTISEASNIFKFDEKLYNSFNLLTELGLGHLKLGQSATTLSGGEAQRIKLGKALINKPKNKCLYLMDEPTTGLHFADIEKLIKVLFSLRESGHALYIIEHHPWFELIADHIVRLGPVGGNKGGYLI